MRVFVLDFDSLPAKAAEAVSVVRFRLRKMVPFDVEHAGVSYQVLSQNETECKVLAAVMPGPILAEYEAAVRAAGYEPGAVLPSSLAALEALDSMEAGADREPERALADHVHRQRAGPAALSHARPARGPAQRKAKCSAALPWPPRISKTSWARGRGRLYYAGIESRGRFCALGR